MRRLVVVVPPTAPAGRRRHLFVGYQRVGLRPDGSEVKRSVFRQTLPLTEPQALGRFRQLVAQYDGVGWWVQDAKAGRWIQRH